MCQWRGRCIGDLCWGSMSGKGERGGHIPHAAEWYGVRLWGVVGNDVGGKIMKGKGRKKGDREMKGHLGTVGLNV